MASRDARDVAPALLLVAGLLAVVAGTWWQVASPDRPAGGAPGSPVVAEPVGAEASVLAGWDRRRAAAYSRGDVPALRSLYLPGSGAGEADVAVLRAWLRRGLRVEGLRTQVLDRRVVARGPGRMVLRVTDRMVGAVAVRAGGVRARLPADRPGERTVTLVRHEGRWVVARVV
ncbi:hypothetical protein EKO23_15910 [Nocardioides guangzhouensis]|uniref:SnoaL-like domain-containing protein n=1 Tax=Nocardioides guangzhouensis TaxID=2497878 RepID=A0A4Q4ZB16_9ACTN|nr:hypothetical protein [Nocardioides guangzhouensis]RYP84324.1 hypothetical protein EKO23_15910 [Nocardioides guangzhouensis]